MKRIALLPIAAWILSGCASDPLVMKLPPPEGIPRETSVMSPRAPPDAHLRELQMQLGLNRSSDDLGFADKLFDGCSVGFKGTDGRCGRRFLSVVHFRLVCRDTVGTTSRVPASLTPLASGNMEWRLGGVRGNLTTDNLGYGQVQMVSMRPVKSERFMLIIGKKILGLEAGEVSQIVLPGNWCDRLAMN